MNILSSIDSSSFFKPPSSGNILPAYPPNATPLTGSTLMVVQNSAIISPNNTSSLTFPDGLDPFTIEFWYKPGQIDTVDNQAVFSAGPTGNNFCIMMSFYSTSPVYNYRQKLVIVTSTGTSFSLFNVRISTALNLTNNVWSHILIQRNKRAVVGTQTAGDLQIFIDGILRGYGTLGTDTANGGCNMNRGNFWLMGRQYGGLTNNFCGAGTQVAGLRVSSIARITNLPTTLSTGNIGTQYFIPSKGQIPSASQSAPSTTDNYVYASNFTDSATNLTILGAGYNWITTGTIQWTSNNPNV